LLGKKIADQIQFFQIPHDLTHFVPKLIVPSIISNGQAIAKIMLVFFSTQRDHEPDIVKQEWISLAVTR
jgi:hypothetical protein